MDVAIPVLRQVSHDRLARIPSAEPCVLVIENVRAVAHQIGPLVTLEKMYAVLTRPQQSIEFHVSRVVVARRMVVKQLRPVQGF